MLPKSLNTLLKKNRKLAASQTNGAFDFARELQNIEPKKGEIVMGFDMTSLYNSAPIRNRLEFSIFPNDFRQ